MNDGRGKARTEPRAVVIGGSMAGLFAALLLRQAGWRVDVYERIGAELAGRGAGIVTHKELFDVLARAGIDTAAAALGVSVPGRRVLDRDGRVAGELALATGSHVMGPPVRSVEGRDSGELLSPR